MKRTKEETISAVINFSKGEVTKAITDLVKLIETDPEHSPALFQLGEFLNQIGKWNEALRFYQKALIVNPGKSAHWERLIAIFIQLDKNNDALQLIQAANNRSLKSKKLQDLEFNLIQRQLKRSVKQTPFKEQLFELFVTISISPEKYHKEFIHENQQFIDLCELIQIPKERRSSLEDILSFIEANLNVYDKTKTYYLLITIFMYAIWGDMRKAFSKLRHIKDILEHSDYDLCFACLHSLSGNKNKAVDRTLKCLENDKKNSNAILLSILLMSKNRQFIEAYDLFLKSLTVVTPNFGFIKAIAECNFQLKKYYLASSLYGLVPIKHIDIEQHYTQAMCLFYIGQYTESLEWFDGYLKKNSSDQVVMNNYALANKKVGNYNKATKILKTLENVGSIDATINLGNMCKERGELLHAIQYYEKGQKSYPIKSFLPLHSLYIQLGNNHTLCRNRISHIIEKNKLKLRSDAKFIIQRSIYYFLKRDYRETEIWLERYEKLQIADKANLNAVDKTFCDAYFAYICELLKYKTENIHNDTITHLGESHCLSFNGQVIKDGDTVFQVQPKIIFGAKAHHFSLDGDNKYKSIARSQLTEIGDGSKIFLSFGEIDCRHNEGISAAAVKNNLDVDDLVNQTVSGYVKWFVNETSKRNLKIYFFTVPAPVYREELMLSQNIHTAKIVRLYNQALKKIVEDNNLKLINTYSLTADKNGFSNNKYHVDRHHLGPTILKDMTAMLHLTH